MEKRVSRNLLGLDPGFASFGWSVVALYPDGEEISAMGVFRTQKESSKRHVLACEDSFERTRAIAKFLDGLIEQWDPKVVCFEAWSPVRNASAAAKVAFAYGALGANLARGTGLPAVSPTPQRVKKALTGKVNASKEEVESEVRKRFGGTSPKVLQTFSKAVPRSQQVHAFDSLAVVIASLESEVVRTVRRFV
jgi:Holliday junction resolvasome RuvABC endonuclease subunit